MLIRFKDLLKLLPVKKRMLQYYINCGAIKIVYDGLGRKRYDSDDLLELGVKQEDIDNLIPIQVREYRAFIRGD